MLITSMILSRGDHSFLPQQNFEDLGPSALMLANMRYAGYQVGYVVWSYVISFVLMAVITFAISQQVFVPLITRRYDSVLISLIKDYV